jgi:hypothetical protein
MKNQFLSLIAAAGLMAGSVSQINAMDPESGLLLVATGAAIGLSARNKQLKQAADDIKAAQRQEIEQKAIFTAVLNKLNQENVKVRYESYSLSLSNFTPAEVQGSSNSLPISKNQSAVQCKVTRTSSIYKGNAETGKYVTNIINPAIGQTQEEYESQAREEIGNNLTGTLKFNRMWKLGGNAFDGIID